MSNELTPAEIVAVKLLGWTRENNPLYPDEREYSHPSGSFHTIGGELNGTGCGEVGAEDFPDFIDNYAAWYWIRRVEDALDKKGLIARYLVHLCHHKFVLRATVPQRLEAAIRVIEEVGL
jgi:hypothetical protein